MNQLSLSSFIHTPSDANTFSNGVTAVLASLYHSDFVFAKKVGQVFGEEVGATLLKQATEQKIDITSPKAITKFLNDLLSEVKNMPQITVTTAFLPTPSWQKRLQDWFSKEVATSVLITTAHDPSIVGGATLQKDGKYYDFSVATRLEKMVIPSSVCP